MQTGKTELLTPEVREKLSSLRRALTGRLAIEGLAWTVTALVALVFATLALDYMLRLERPLRVTIMAMALVGVAYVIWRTLIQPLRVPMGSKDLALLVESRFAQLGDRLVSAVVFSGRGEAELVGASPAMVAHMAAEANAMAKPLEFGEIVERRGIFRSWSVAGCALALLLGFGMVQGDLLSRWFKRNVLLTDVPWPQSTYVKVRGEGDFVVMRGDDLKVEIDVEPRSLRVPQYVEIRATFRGIGRTEERIEADPDNPMHFAKVFPAVPEPFEFYVVAGDDHRDAREPHRVVLIDPPSFREVQFTVTRPSYTENPRPEPYDGSAGVLTVPAGARIRIDAMANKPLSVGEDGARRQEGRRLPASRLGAGERRVRRAGRGRGSSASSSCRRSTRPRTTCCGSPLPTRPATRIAAGRSIACRSSRTAPDGGDEQARRGRADLADGDHSASPADPRRLRDRFGSRVGHARRRAGRRQRDRGARAGGAGRARRACRAR